MNTKITLISLVLITMVTMGVADGLEGEDVEKILDTTIETDFTGTYSIVDTGQITFYDDKNEMLITPQEKMPFYGQDAMYDGNQPLYLDNGDGTVTDLVTGLMWQQDPGEKMSFDEALSGANTFSLAGFDDWRLPTIKELYSLILFSGEDVSPEAEESGNMEPFIDTDYFNFEYGDTSADERIIDAQYASSTVYVGNSELGQLVFGVNFADGRIKGYGTAGMPGQEGGKTFFVLYVRGNEDYGRNNYVDNGDGTITDLATGLMWQTVDSGEGMNWEDALDYSEDLEYAGYDDWRLPNIKELQSIVDYSRSPDTHGTAAIDPIFSVTSIIDEGGNTNYPFHWSSTTHANAQGGSFAAYVAFGEALGFMGTSDNNIPPQQGGGEDLPPPGDEGSLSPSPGGEDPPINGSEGETQLMDVHGAGAQRSDPKSGEPADYENGNGPQGDVVRIYNYVRCVRQVEIVIDENTTDVEDIFDNETQDETGDQGETPDDDPETGLENDTQYGSEYDEVPGDDSAEDLENDTKIDSDTDEEPQGNDQVVSDNGESGPSDNDEGTDIKVEANSSWNNAVFIIAGVLILLFLISIAAILFVLLKQKKETDE